MNQKGTAQIFIVVAIILLIVAGGVYLFNQSKGNTQTSNQPQQPKTTLTNDGLIADCSSHERLLSFIKDVWKDQTLDIETDPNNFGGTLEWKRNNNEPFITYPGIHWSNIKLGESLDKSVEMYKSKVDRIFIQNGFRVDPINTTTIKLPNGLQNPPDSYRYGYFKGNTLYLIDLTASDLSPTWITVICAQRDQVLDETYNELLPQKSIQSELSKSAGRGGVQSMVFGIETNKIYPNGVVEATETSHDWLGGNSAWFYKVNGEWKFLGTSLGPLPCKLLRDHHLESGVPCNTP